LVTSAASRDIAEQFKDFGTGQGRPGCDVGRYVCQVSMRIADIACIDAEYLGTTAAGANETEEQSNSGRFPGTIGAEEPEDLFRLDGEADVVKGDDLAEPFRQTVDADSELG
jgi:hypothetical protein